MLALWRVRRTWGLLLLTDIGVVCSVMFGYMVQARGNYQEPLWLIAAMVLAAALLFTRIDETEGYRALVTEAARRQLPISFLTAGQSIPDDIEPATRRRVAALVEGRATGAPATAGPDAARSVGASA